MIKKILIGSLLAVSLAACGNDGTTDVKEESKPEKVKKEIPEKKKEQVATINKEKYEQLKKGMTYNEVKKIVGGKAKEKDKGTYTTTYKFDGEGGFEKDSTVELSFRDSKLESIFENGLVYKEVKINKEQYKKIKLGMSPKEVKDLVGGKPKGIYVGDSRFEYEAEGGVDEDAVVTLEFEDDKLVEMSEDGLLTKSMNAGVDEETEDDQSDENIAEGSQSDSDVNMLNDSFDWLMEDQNYAITAIAPIDENDYSVIYATVADEVKLLTKEEKQVLVDDWGNSIINLVNTNLYGGDKSNSPMVHFKYQDGSKLADQKMLDGWKIKD